MASKKLPTPPPGRPRLRERDEDDDQRLCRLPPPQLDATEYEWPPDDAHPGSPKWAAILATTIDRFHEMIRELGVPKFGSKSVIYVNSKTLRLALQECQAPKPTRARSRLAKTTKRK